MTLPTGSRLGPYEILSAVGAGGMGEAYKARDTRLERTVAVKALPARLSAVPLGLDRELPNPYAPAMSMRMRMSIK